MWILYLVLDTLRNNLAELKTYAELNLNVAFPFSFFPRSDCPLSDVESLICCREDVNWSPREYARMEGCLDDAYQPCFYAVNVS